MCYKKQYANGLRYIGLWTSSTIGFSKLQIFTEVMFRSVSLGEGIFFLLDVCSLHVTVSLCRFQNFCIFFRKDVVKMRWSFPTRTLTFPYTITLYVGDFLYRDRTSTQKQHVDSSRTYDEALRFTAMTTKCRHSKFQPQIIGKSDAVTLTILATISHKLNN